MTRARQVFAALGMHRTTHRAGVLIYLAVEDRKLAIVGDEGIHARVGDEYWSAVRDAMVARNTPIEAGRPSGVPAVAGTGQACREMDRAAGRRALPSGFPQVRTAQVGRVQDVH